MKILLSSFVFYTPCSPFISLCEINKVNAQHFQKDQEILLARKRKMSPTVGRAHLPSPSSQHSHRNITDRTHRLEEDPSWRCFEISSTSNTSSMKLHEIWSTRWLRGSSNIRRAGGQRGGSTLSTLAFFLFTRINAFAHNTSCSPFGISTKLPEAKY